MRARVGLSWRPGRGHGGTIQRLEPFARRLGMLAGRRASGALVVEAGEVRRELYLKDGVVVQAVSRLAEEALGTILVKMSLISSDERDAMLEQAAEEGRMLGNVLIEAGLITPMEVSDALTEQVRLRVTSCLRLERYTAAFEEGRSPASKFRVSLPVPALLLRAVGDAVAVERMRAHLGLGPMSRFRLQVPLADSLLGLDAGPGHWRIVRSFEGARFVDLADDDVDLENVLTLAYTLWALGRLEVVGDDRDETLEPRSRGEVPAAREDADEAGGATPTVPGSTAADPARSTHGGRGSRSGAPRVSARQPEQRASRRPSGREKGPAGRGEIFDLSQQVVDAWLRAERQDYFELLGVPRDAGPSDVTIAYGALLRRFKLENPPRDWPDQAKQAAAGLLSRASLAFAVLTDSKERKGYRCHLRSGGGEFEPQNPMVRVGAALRTAERLRNGGRFSEAVEALEEAAAGFPREPDVHLALGRTYYEWALKKGAEKEDECANALAVAARLDPARSDPWLYLGLLAKHKGDESHAVNMFRKALSVNPRNQRAARELSTLESDTGLLEKLFGK